MSNLDPQPENAHASGAQSRAFRENDGDGYRLVLLKAGQRYEFRYAPGEEARVLSGVMDMVRQADSGLDCFDAAVLSHQMGRHMKHALRELRAGSA